MVSLCLHNGEYHATQAVHAAHVFRWDEFESGLWSSWGFLFALIWVLNLTSEDASQRDFDVNSVTGLCMSGAWTSALVKVSVDALQTQMTRVGLSWTLRHPGPSGCCADQCDDECKAWHLNVESLLALTDVVCAGVGQSRLVGFIYNVISSPGFGGDRRWDGAADAWGPSVLPG